MSDSDSRYVTRNARSEGDARPSKDALKEEKARNVTTWLQDVVQETVKKRRAAISSVHRFDDHAVDVTLDDGATYRISVRHL